MVKRGKRIECVSEQREANLCKLKRRWKEECEKKSERELHRKRMTVRGEGGGGMK